MAAISSGNIAGMKGASPREEKSSSLTDEVRTIISMVRSLPDAGASRNLFAHSRVVEASSSGYTSNPTIFLLGWDKVTRKMAEILKRQISLDPQEIEGTSNLESKILDQLSIENSEGKCTILYNVGEISLTPVLLNYARNEHKKPACLILTSLSPLPDTINEDLATFLIYSDVFEE